MSKTTIRKELDKELADKLLLNDASMWQITRHLLKKHSVQICIALVTGVVIGVVA